MAKKYHIDAHGKVVPCRATFRACPRTDYSTEEAAYSALFLQSEKHKLDTARENVQQAFNNPNIKRSSIHTDFSGQSKRNTLRAYAEQLDADFYQTGEEPEFFSLKSELKQDNISYSRDSQKIYINRIPVPDYDNGKITSSWFITVEKPNSTHMQKTEKYELDLHNNFESAMVKAEDIIRENVIANGNYRVDADTVKDQTQYLSTQLRKAYFAAEEEASDISKVWGTHEGYGTFGKSDPQTIHVNEEYEHSAFRGRMFEKFLNSNPYYKTLTPETNIRVYDNESGSSENGWSVRYINGQWNVEVLSNGKRYRNAINSAEQGYDFIYRYVQKEMKTNDEETARRKATYVSDLITDINLAMSNFVKKKNRADEQARQTKSEQQSASIFGDNNSGTMKSIIGMYS